MKARFFMLILIIGSLKLFSQDTLDTKIDTLCFYEKNSGVGTKVYMKQWFAKSHSYKLKDVTYQDSIALDLIDTLKKLIYIKLFNHKNRLVFEGLISNENSNKQFYASDKVKFYKKGRLSRIEYWNFLKHIDSCGEFSTESLEPYGHWQFFKKGRLKKTKTYVFISKDCSKGYPDKLLTTTWYSKKVKKRKVREIKIY